MCGKVLRAAGALLVVLVFGAAPAWADSIEFTFVRIASAAESPTASTDPILKVIVSDESHLGGSLTNQVRFTFINEVQGPSGERLNAGDAGYSTIAEVYFDDGTLFGLSSVVNDPDFTSFVGGSADPGDLPGGQNVVPPFEATAGFVADTTPGPPNNGVDYIQERLHIYFDLQSGKSFADVLSALALTSSDQDDWLRIGLHVRSIGELEESASFINAPNPIPTPGAALGGLALMGMVICGRRRSRTVA